MAAAPAFASVVRHTDTILSGTIETSLTTPTQAVSCFTAGANGSKIEEIVIDMQKAALTPQSAVGLIYLFVEDTANASAVYMFDTIAVTAVTASATTAPFRSVPYRLPNFWLTSTQSLLMSISVVPVTGLYVAHCFAGDY
jgi:hypothetical protein